MGVEGKGRRSASGILEARWKFVDLPRDVRRNSTAAGVARVREPRGSNGLREVAWASAAERSAISSRRLWNARGPERTELSLGRRDPPSARHGNFDFHQWDPAPVGSYPEGASAFGVHDLVGNGWEWTRTPFAPFPGFAPMPFYPGYSANFFDGKHYVMKGGSPRTAACMLRRSFRNWFQPHYPYVYATFRCVEE